MQRSWVLVALPMLLAAACGGTRQTATADDHDVPPPSSVEPRLSVDFGAPGPPGYTLTPALAPAAIVATVQSISQPEWNTQDGDAPASQGRRDTVASKFKWATVEVERVLWEDPADRMPEGRTTHTIPAATTLRVVIWLPSEDGGGQDRPSVYLGPEVDVGDRVLWALYPWRAGNSENPGPVVPGIARETAWAITEDGMAVHEHWADEPPVDIEVLIGRMLDAHTNPQNWTTGEMRNLMNPDRIEEPSTTTTTTEPAPTTTAG